MEEHPKPRKKRSVTKVPLPVKPSNDTKLGEKIFPIIGIGASAGGLEALELFLKNLPPAPGMAFVIVQHLDPTHKGIMAELLQRATPMPVSQITDNLKVEKNHVYIIPPNTDLTLFHGVLRLLVPVKPRGLRLPIDFFFRSLAEDLAELSVGVILSGMGSDGMLGLRAIKEAGGSSFVQNPETSKFDGMPSSAINSGLADVVAPAEEIPKKILDYFKHFPYQHSYSQFTLQDKMQSGFDKIMFILRSRTGHDFSLYKKSTIYRRIERRMSIHSIERIHDYVRFLQENTSESELLFNELLIGVTSFFRDPDAWETLKNDAIPLLLASNPVGGVLRAWSVGCSTGEEAYSLAILFKEAIDNLRPAQNYTLQIFATDLDKRAIDIAREGYYPNNIVADVSEQRLLSSFTKDEQGYRVNKNLREQIVFAPQNLIKDPPFTKLDILVCRNLLIYMEPELQQKLIPLFHYSLKPGGFLFLGSAESLYGDTDFFIKLKSKSTIFQRNPNPSSTKFIDFADTFSGVFHGIYPKKITSEQKNESVVSLSTLVDNLILKNYAPVSVLTTRMGDIVYINGSTGKYLEPISGKVNWNIFVMVRDELKYPMSHAFQKALRTNKTALIKDTLVKGSKNTESVMVHISVEPIKKPDQLSGMFLFVFTETDVVKGSTIEMALDEKQNFSPDQQRLVDELKSVRSELLASHEDMQTSQEELKSINEELLSSNEELQSTNEELSTAKEEMQSLNEELQTVNQELQGKVDELGRTSDDMKNLLNSTEIATLFLDEQLKIRSFTKAMTSISKYMPIDKGRPFSDIASTLNYPELRENAIGVLNTLIYNETQISTTDDRWFLIRIMPYYTQKNRINGLVITFIDITLSKKLELKLLDIEKRFIVMFKQMPRGSFFLNSDGTISMVNPVAERFFRLTEEEMADKSFKELNGNMVSEEGSGFAPGKDPFAVAFSTEKAVKGAVIGFSFSPDNQYVWMLADIIPQFYEGKSNPYLLFVTFEEIADPRKTETISKMHR